MRRHLKAASAKLAAKLIPFMSAVVLSAAACQSAPVSSATPASAAFPVVIHSGDGSTLTIDHQPRRIVSLSPSATEMLFAIGAGKQVVAVDEQSNYPRTAPVTKLSGFQPNIEAIAGYAPDLVVASDDTGGLVRGLQSVSTATLLEPAAKTLDDSYTQILQLGRATGHPTEALALVTKLQRDVAAIVASVGKPRRPLSVYHELDDTYYSATSKTFIGQLYVLLGLNNIADRAAGTAPDYPQLSSEFIVAASPDLVVLADTKCCKQSLQTVASRPGWASIAAVRTGEVVQVDDDVASRWGPRVTDFLRVIAARVREIEQRG
ncbi:MAG TPA: ABC transporter substrate-binding protein [Candidatus Limnocylindrales bacterium]|nr:ABC transporter substrate-binding protein [Candidatus Limnocylindrales bacterium]